MLGGTSFQHHGHLHYAVLTAEVATVAHHADYHVHVLGERVARVSAGGYDHLLVEKAVTSRHVGHGIDRRPAHLADEERAHVLQRLEQGARLVGRTRVGYLAVLHLTTVGNGHYSADGYHLLVLEYGDDTLRNGVAHKDSVHVDVHEVGIRRGVEPGVHGVCLGSSVLLVDDDQAVVFGVGRLEQAAVGLRADVLYVGEGHLYELEVLDEQLERLVLTAVVHDDDLELRVVLAQQRVDVLHDGALLIVGRRYYRHARRVGALVDYLLGVKAEVAALLAEDAELGKPHEYDV